jgi:site-specific recombinase XerD
VDKPRHRGGHFSADNLTADDLRAYSDHLRDRGLAQSSVATKVRSLKAFGKWLDAEEYVGRDPFAKVRQTKVDDVPKATLDPVDVDLFLATCDRTRVAGARDFAIMLLLFSTVLRAGEVVALQVADIDGDKGLLMIRLFPPNYHSLRTYAVDVRV